MSQQINKDELVQLLRIGNIERFNESRPYHESDFLDLTEIDLSNIKILGANFSKTDLSGSDFSQSEIEDIDFSGSDLSSVNFSHSTITGSNFVETSIEGSLFNNAGIISGDFSEVNFNGVNICGTDFTGVDLSLSINLMQSIYDADTVWPDEDYLPEDFEPEEDISIAELEDAEGYMEESF